MSYEISTRAMPGYLHVTVAGQNSSNTVIEYITAVGKLCDEQKASVVLIEENLAGPGLTMFDIFKIIRSFRQFPKSLRWIVYVDTNPAHDRGMMDFAKDLAVQRGLRVHIARSVPDAEAWIDTWVK